MTSIEINDLENKVGLKFNNDFTKFLSTSNGLNVFVTTFNIYGLKQNYKRDLYNVWQPFDIVTINTKERPKVAKNDFLFIGSYNWDGSLLYIDHIGTTYRCSRDGRKVFNKWMDFYEMLEKEIARLISLFDENGKQLDQHRPTTPVDELAKAGKGEML